MAFTSYASASDVEAYYPGATRDLWSGRKADVEDSLARAAKRMNERFSGMDKFDTVPMAVESGGAYAEILIELNVFEALVARVRGIYAGEAFAEHWAWLFARHNILWGEVTEGTYSFGGEPLKASAGASAVSLSRQSV